MQDSDSSITIYTCPRCGGNVSVSTSTSELTMMVDENALCSCTWLQRTSYQVLEFWFSPYGVSTTVFLMTFVYALSKGQLLVMVLLFLMHMFVLFILSKRSARTA